MKRPIRWGWLTLVAAFLLCTDAPCGRSTVRADDALSISLSSDGLAQLHLQGNAHKNYLIRSTDNLLAGNWITLKTGATDAAGSLQASDARARVSARFYQAARQADLQATTNAVTTVPGSALLVVLTGNDPLNPGGALTAIITELPTGGTLQQFDGTPITAVDTVVTDAQNRVRFIPVANAPGDTSFTYQLRRESDGVTSARQPVAVSLSPNWVFSSFDDSKQQLQLAYSLDGTRWAKTDALYAPPTGDGVRDSSIVKLDGVYYVASTAGYFGGADYVQICRSTDLVHWTYVCNVSTVFPGYSGYSWAPEWFVDRDGTVYLYLARPNTNGQWQLFYTTPTATDLTTWNTIQKVGGDMLSRVAIDGQVVRDGDTYYLVYRNYGGTECAEMARGTSPTTFSLYKTGDWAGWGVPREGPCLLHLGGTNWRIYMVLAAGSNPATLGGSYVAYSESHDGMTSWTPLVGVDVPQHGTCYPLRNGLIASDKSNVEGGQPKVPEGPHQRTSRAVR